MSGPREVADRAPVIEARGNTVHHDGFCSPVTLTTEVVGVGEIEPPANSPRQFEQNDWIDVQAFETDPEWRFESWLTTPPLGIEYLSNTAPIPMSPYLSFPIGVDTVVTANFTRPAHELTIAVQGTGSTPPPPGVYRFFSGEVAEIDASTSQPNLFGWWEDAAGQTIGTDSHLDITMDADKTHQNGPVAARPRLQPLDRNQSRIQPALCHPESCNPRPVRGSHSSRSPLSSLLQTHHGIFAITVSPHTSPKSNPPCASTRISVNPRLYRPFPVNSRGHRLLHSAVPVAMLFRMMQGRGTPNAPE